MKKLLCVVMCCLIILYGCRYNSTAILEDLNEHSNFMYPLTTSVTPDIESNFSVYPGFGIRILVNKEIDVMNDDIDLYMDNHETTYYHVTAYPDHSSSGDFITRIETTDKTKYVYDLHVGDTYTKDELTSYLKTLGYKSNETILQAYDNHGVRIRVALKDDVIVKLSVEVLVTNRFGIIF